MAQREGHGRSIVNRQSVKAYSHKSQLKPHSDYTHPRIHMSESATQFDLRATKDERGTTPGYG